MCTIETPLATVEAITDDLQVVRFKTPVKIDTPGILEIVQKADRLTPEGRVSVMALIPEAVEESTAPGSVTREGYLTRVHRPRH